MKRTARDYDLKQWIFYKKLDIDSCEDDARVGRASGSARHSVGCTSAFIIHTFE